MKLAASNSNFVPAPEGTVQGVLCDIVDLGFQEDKFNPGNMIHQMRFVFQTEDRTDEGVPYTVSTFPYKASLNTKANVYKIVKTLLGRDLEASDADEDGEFDLDRLLLGANAMVTVTHNVKGDKTYANIESISQIPKSIKTRLEVEDYVRIKDRAPSATSTDAVESEGVATATAGATKGGKKSDGLNF